MDLVKLNRYHDACMPQGGALIEGYLLRPAKSAGPRVLPAGVTVLLHAGAAPNHGDDEDGCSNIVSDAKGETMFSFRYRNSHLQLTGPMKASEVLQRFSEHVAIEVRQGEGKAYHILTNKDGAGIGTSSDPGPP